MESTKTLEDLVNQWMNWDPDPITRSEIDFLWESKDYNELERRLRKRIEFGTAGLRGAMGGGFSRLNQLTIIQTSQGLARYLRSQIPGAQSKGILIGYDKRHDSELFARVAACTFSAEGFDVTLTEDYVHTPTVPFGIRYCGFAAGVMITASHNPAKDNGYKVYWSNACQILSPHDTGISASILENIVPRPGNLRLLYQSQSGPRRSSKLSTLESFYFGTVLRVSRPLVSVQSNEYPRFVYTAMHGVGARFFEEILYRLEISDKCTYVQEQKEPDGDFPSIKFPNPEEKGALDLAEKWADENDVSLILANDPDADRFAVAEKVDGEWHQLTGDQLGILFASYMMTRSQKKGKDLKKVAMVNSAVSSGMLATMAQKEGFHYEETLTGFKWLGNRSLSLQSEGYSVPFAYEEAIGYCFPEVSFDKDGIAAAAFFLSAAATWNHEEKLTPWGKLEQLYKRYGYYQTNNVYFISPDPKVTQEVFAGIKSKGDPFPQSIGKRKILRWRDLGSAGFDSATSDGKPMLPVSPGAFMITCWLEDDVRFTIRASGTEPKIKLYSECQQSSLQRAKEILDEVFNDICLEWMPSTVEKPL